MSLLDAGFVRELEVLRRRLEVRARSGGSGEHTARRRGGAAEFHEHRAYAPGDDLRRIDWAAYARTGEPVLKLFRAEEDVVARIVCDGSASLGHPGPAAGAGPSKLEVMRKVAAAIAYMALAGSERAQILVAGEGLGQQTAPVRGRAGLGSMLRALERMEARGGTDLAKSIEAVIARSTRPGMLVVLSDFFDPGPVTRGLDRAAAAGHDVFLVQIVTPDEIAPDLEGDWSLEDAETGAVVDVTMDADALEAYASRFAALCAGLRGWARRHRATYVLTRTDEPLADAVRRLITRSVD
jgi:uncharacterized protein (DUF58 family)